MALQCNNFIFKVNQHTRAISELQRWSIYQNHTSKNIGSPRLKKIASTFKKVNIYFWNFWMKIKICLFGYILFASSSSSFFWPFYLKMYLMHHILNEYLLVYEIHEFSWISYITICKNVQRWLQGYIFWPFPQGRIWRRTSWKKEGKHTLIYLYEA